MNFIIITIKDKTDEVTANFKKYADQKYKYLMPDQSEIDLRNYYIKPISLIKKFENTHDEQIQELLNANEQIKHPSLLKVKEFQSNYNNFEMLMGIDQLKYYRKTKDSNKVYIFWDSTILNSTYNHFYSILSNISIDIKRKFDQNDKFFIFGHRVDFGYDIAKGMESNHSASGLAINNPSIYNGDLGAININHFYSLSHVSSGVEEAENGYDIISNLIIELPELNIVPVFEFWESQLSQLGKSTSLRDELKKENLDIPIIKEFIKHVR